jgi:hypothetical protein
MPLLGRAAALLATNVVMIIVAMSLSIFTNHSVYPVYDHVPGVTLSPFADQQIGAAILWVCGDFWALPTMIVTVRKLISDDRGVGTALERFLRTGGAVASADGSVSVEGVSLEGNSPDEGSADGSVTSPGVRAPAVRGWGSSPASRSRPNGSRSNRSWANRSTANPERAGERPGS